MSIDCEIIDAADKAVELLNTPQTPVDWILRFAAVRDYAPLYDLDQIAELQVTVIPKTEDVTGGRIKNDSAIAFDVGIQQRVAGRDDTDQLMRLRRQVRTLFEKGLPPIGSIPTGLGWTGTTGSPIYSVEHLKKGVFTSVLTFSFLTRMQR